jgi:hypothetical protein
MLTGKTIFTAVAVGALAGALLAVWTTVASALDQAPRHPRAASAQHRVVAGDPP